MLTAATEYRDIPGMPGYRAGSDGSIWSSRPRNGRGPAAARWHQLKQRAGRGRYVVELQRGHASYPFAVAHLVLKAFVGPRPPGMEACHNDGDLANNRPSNLRWDTHAANLADRKRHGTEPFGERHPMRKLGVAQVAEIRRRLAEGDGPSSLAREFGVSRNAIARIRRNEIWRQVAAVTEAPS